MQIFQTAFFIVIFNGFDGKRVKPLQTRRRNDKACFFKIRCALSADVLRVTVGAVRLRWGFVRKRIYALPNTKFFKDSRSAKLLKPLTTTISKFPRTHRPLEIYQHTIYISFVLPSSPFQYIVRESIPSGPLQHLHGHCLRVASISHSSIATDQYVAYLRGLISLQSHSKATQWVITDSTWFLKYEVLTGFQIPLSCYKLKYAPVHYTRSWESRPWLSRYRLSGSLQRNKRFKRSIFSPNFLQAAAEGRRINCWTRTRLRIETRRSRHKSDIKCKRSVPRYVPPES